MEDGRRWDAARTKQWGHRGARIVGPLRVDLVDRPGVAFDRVPVPNGGSRGAPSSHPLTGWDKPHHPDM